MEVSFIRDLTGSLKGIFEDLRGREATALLTEFELEEALGPVLIRVRATSTPPDNCCFQQW